MIEKQQLQILILLYECLQFLGIKTREPTDKLRCQFLTQLLW